MEFDKDIDLWPAIDSMTSIDYKNMSASQHDFDKIKNLNNKEKVRFINYDIKGHTQG